jgi:hypothetical protein
MSPSLDRGDPRPPSFDPPSRIGYIEAKKPHE